MSERLTVSYFEPQFHSTVTMWPPSFREEAEAHMADISAKGFDEVIICVTEPDIKIAARTGLLVNTVQAAKDNGLLVTADPWRVGGIFGGEGMSMYEQNGGKPCICEPELENLLLNWLDTVAEAGVQRVFWDEPELSCEDHNLSLELIDRFSQEAVSRGINWNASCIRSRDASIDLSGEVASMIAINEIAVAPYPFHPLNNGVKKTADEVIKGIAPWFQRIKSSADAHNVQAQAWLQGFNISRENMPVLERYMQEIEKAGIGNIAVWGYNACASVTHLNPPSAESPEIVWAKICQLMTESRQAAQHTKTQILAGTSAS